MTLSIPGAILMAVLASLIGFAIGHHLGGAEETARIGGIVQAQQFGSPADRPLAHPSVTLEFASGTDLDSWFNCKNFGPHGDYPGIFSVDVDYQGQNPQGDRPPCPTKGN